MPEQIDGDTKVTAQGTFVWRNGKWHKLGTAKNPLPLTVREDDRKL